eukprot:2596974-Prymnesium_polylepis.1
MCIRDSTCARRESRGGGGQATAPSVRGGSTGYSPRTQTDAERTRNSCFSASAVSPKTLPFWAVT